MAIRSYTAKRLMRRRQTGGFVLMEVVLVFLIVALIIGIVSVDVVGVLRKLRLDKDISDFAQTLQQVVDQAVFSGVTYVVAIEVTDGYYTVYEDQGEERRGDEEPFIPEDQLKWCYIEDVEYEDGSHQYSGDLELVATPQGWERSVLLSLLDDRNERQRFLRCERLTRNIQVAGYPLVLPEALEDVSMSTPL